MSTIICRVCGNPYNVRDGEGVYIDHLERCQPEKYPAMKKEYEQRKNRMPNIWE